MHHKNGFNAHLAAAIERSGYKKGVLCLWVDMTPWRLSRVIHGVLKPTRDEQRRLAKVLKRPVRELFPEREAVSR